MKTTLNLRTLKRLNACEEGYKTFKAAHGSKTVTLTEALNSNGWNDIWWYLKKGKLTKKQNVDVRLLACDYVEHVLHIFEDKFPNDLRPRKVIETARLFAKGQCTRKELDAAANAAYDNAAYANAAYAAYAAELAAAELAAAELAAAAAAAADVAAYANAANAAAAAAAERHWQIDKLKELFADWEKTANKGE